MLADGAHLNVSARRALDTILGGKESPKEDERMSQAEFAEWIRSTPTEEEDVDENLDFDYGEAARLIAKLYLRALEEAVASQDSHEVWQVVQERWPKAAKRAEGGTGFMHGWAFNAARHVLKLPPVSNPALIEIET